MSPVPEPRSRPEPEHREPQHSASGHPRPAGADPAPGPAAGTGAASGTGDTAGARDTADAGDTSGGAGRRSLAAALALGAAGAALALVAGGQTWSEATTTAAQGALRVTAEGRDVTGVPAALAVVGLAALVAVFAVRRAGRAAVAALLALSGAGTAAGSLYGRADTGALEAEAARATGLVGAGVENVTHTPWPLVSTAAGLLLLLAGLLALRHGHRWPAMSGRYERPSGVPRRGAAAPGPERPEEMWRALDRGEDPTRDR
ncbi:TIGR02234 family membrane protein [Streptomyces sp. WAC 00631]|uniref:TIGR02234 family membrane protein n=1 Tax=unclassified Streptomyces TaxID=2593676 RepID=UPI000F7AC163|nr:MULTISPECIES: TIGR02234 family membrane protein [unclassified Streptomyces]MCC5034505.1 TIGR02234 family membrane protein [Streptomyces sp. WAC 00631]MCC5037295.1 TIGR02234 family membrane protein [Streptomyces sp. WAC 00631]MCC9742125.1 TIGR02234 family membrane protein [Streptomyces sp. MNU89]